MEDFHTILKASTNFIGGAVGGAGSTCLSHPLDSLKVKMQTFPGRYRSGLHCMRHVLRLEGLRGFYRGLGPAVTLGMTEASIRYGTYGVCQDITRVLFRVRSDEQMALLHNACAGGLTGFLASFASCPIELVKCRMQGSLELMGNGVAKGSNTVSVIRRTPLAMVAYILRVDGVRGLFRGFSSNLARNTPGELVFFAAYEQCRSLLKGKDQVKDSLGPLGNFVCGSVAGISYWVSIYPLDSVKSRVQILSTQGQVQGLVTTFWNIVKVEGIRSLYSGVGYSIPRAMIGSGSHFVFYETTRKIIKRSTESQN